ncbi:Aste57867_1455 [Aphanomyces stellatus]|uniref:Aste57867_1455 protein n=1 Tax=Aphanomyces stellatus TaxID=120398 RepID=A0A485K549_9STRA|nr:hypothetical protein As57867_001454 [Aphanomyces stellatus]VFT78672.1 Aste57867_1455 [Aphanomyces stellatus]
MSCQGTTNPLQRSRGQCRVEHCVSQVYARQLCCKHGAKKTCDVQGCELRARHGNVCYKHGAPKKLCTETGCHQTAQARHKCVKHGGGRICKAEGCESHARTGGVCQRHKADPSEMSKWDEPKTMTNILLGRRDSVASLDDVSDWATQTGETASFMPILWTYTSCPPTWDAMVLQDIYEVLEIL